MDRVRQPASRSLIGTYCGYYRLVGILGKGNFGIVYLGIHRHLCTYAAIKIPYNQTLIATQEQFSKEARTAARLQHPHIARVLEYGKEGKILYLVMEYASHGALRQHHPYGERVPLSTVIRYMKQTADALQYIHEGGFIHQDVKLDNMLLNHVDNILLSDFGTMIAVCDAEMIRGMKSIGTISHMAPEHIQGNPCFASDQYSLGVVAYELLCGQLPFEGNSSQMAQNHLFTDPAPLSTHIPSIPPAVEQVVLRTLAKQPEQRFASVQAFAQNLEEAYKEACSVKTPRPLILPGISNVQKTSLQKRRNMLHPDRKFSCRRKPRTNTWKEATLLFIADITVGIPVFATLYLLGIPVLSLWFFLGLCFVSLPLLVAVYLKRKGILLYTSAVLAVSATFGISFHSPILFIVLYTMCLLVSIYITFTLSILDK